MPKNIPSEMEAITRIHMVKKRPVIQILHVIPLGNITRALRSVRNLKGKVYVVGGIVTEGVTLRDIDIVVTDKRDIPKLQKALGRFAKRAHFLIQKAEPPAPLFVKITGREPRSPDLFRRKKGQRIPRYEYAAPA